MNGFPVQHLEGHVAMQNLHESALKIKRQLAKPDSVGNWLSNIFVFRGHGILIQSARDVVCLVVVSDGRSYVSSIAAEVICPTQRC